MHINIAKVNFKSIGINIAKVDFGLYDVAKPQLDGLYITPAEENIVIKVTPNSNYYSLHGKYLKYSFDGKTWNDWNGGVTIWPEQKMYVKGEDGYVWTGSTSGKLITSTSYYNVGGNISSLTNYIDSVKEYTFTGLFNGDSYIKDASNLILPATTLAPRCYYYMFYGCSSLTTAPALPATELAQSCYYYMFSGCSSLATAPALPATELAQYCYYSMFEGCKSLTTAPELPATTLEPACYYYMFNGCSSLNSITMLATNISASDCLSGWVSGVASTGTFIKSPEMTSLPVGANGIPSGWIVFDDSDYLTLSALGDGEITITIPSQVNSTYATSLSYSKDKSSWVETVVDDTDQTITIPVSSGEDVYLKGKAKQWSVNTSPMYSMNINSSANIIASGNTMSLLYEDVFKDKTVFPEGAVYIFRELFKNNTHLINAENLILPATELVDYCYYGMFYGCASLATAPELPATKLAVWCYYNMFYNCKSLETAPALPATELASGCYSQMFYDCDSLATTPDLPATELKPNCYYRMFRKCPSLTTAPKLPATKLADYCYYEMFYDCTSLTTAPELPATTLVDHCYYGMFLNCTSLNNITMLATSISATGCLNGWVRNVASTGTFTKAASMTTLPTGASGIPSGWTVVNK